MLNKSIAYRLSIYISLAVIAVFIAFIAIYFLFNVSIIKENIENKAVNISGEIKGKVNQYVNVTVEVTENIADQIIFYDQHHSVQPFIEQLVRKYPFINAIHINLDSTIPLDYHNFFCFNAVDSILFFNENKPLKTCVTEQPHFKKLLESDTPAWSEPLFCERNNHIVVSYYAPVQVNDINGTPQNVGEIICELSLFQLSKTINQIQIGEKGFAFLLSKEGTFITHPLDDWILTKSIFDIPRKVLDEDELALKAFLEQPSSGSIIARPEILNYEKSWVYYSQLENDWILIIAIPYEEMFEPLYLPILKMLFFSVLGILVIYILITYITNRQIQPLSNLTNQLKRFSSLSGESFAGDDSMNEIKHVSESLNLLRTWYEKNKIRVSREEKLNKLKDDDIYQAAEIQQSLIKIDYPAFPGNPEIDLCTSYKPARIVSGDLFDYFFRDEDELVLSVGDVSGKGVPAAFFMSVAQTVIKSVAVDTLEHKSSSIVHRINNELYSNNVHQFFLTLFLGILNIKTGKLSYCNAAHTTSYVLKADGRLETLSDSHGLPLGLYRDKGYRESRYKMEKGDSLILYTDGVTELLDENNIQYGHDRLKENLQSLKGLDSKSMVLKIEKSLQQFMGEGSQNDDICILILKYNA